VIVDGLQRAAVGARSVRIRSRVRLDGKTGDKT